MFIDIRSSGSVPSSRLLSASALERGRYLAKVLFDRDLLAVRELENRPGVGLFECGQPHGADADAPSGVGIGQHDQLDVWAVAFSSRRHR